MRRCRGGMAPHCILLKRNDSSKRINPHPQQLVVGNHTISVVSCVTSAATAVARRGGQRCSQKAHLLVTRGRLQLEIGNAIALTQPQTHEYNVMR